MRGWLTFSLCRAVLLVIHQQMQLHQGCWERGRGCEGEENKEGWIEWGGIRGLSLRD